MVATSHTEIQITAARRCRLCSRRIGPGTAMIVKWTDLPKRTTHIGYYHSDPCGIAMIDAIREFEAPKKVKKKHPLKPD